MTTGKHRLLHCVAAHQDKLEPYEWSYPVVGAIPYRGYFDRAQADGFAEKMLKGKA